MKTFSFLIICFLLLIGCKPKKSERYTHNPFAVNVTFDNSKTIKASEIFKRPVLIPLNTPDSLLLGNVSQIIISNKNIIVLESYSPFGRLFIFDRSGSYLHDFGQRGRGPNEFHGAKGIALNENNDEITYQELIGKPGLVSSRLDGELMKYRNHKTTRIANGGYSLIQDFNTGFYVISLEYIGDLDKNKRTKVKLGIYDDEKNIMFPAIMDPLGFTLPIGIINYNQLFRFSDNVYFKPVTWDTIYRISGNKAIPEYYLDFGKHSLPNRMHYAKTELEYFSLRNSNPIAAFIHYFWAETNNFFIGAFKVGSIGDVLFIQGKSSGKSLAVNQFQNDYIGETNPAALSKGYLPQKVISDTLVILHEPSVLINGLQDIKHSLTSEDFREFKESNYQYVEMVEKLNITDNPIIGLYPLKSNLLK